MRSLIPYKKKLLSFHALTTGQKRDDCDIQLSDNIGMSEDINLEVTSLILSTVELFKKHKFHTT